MFSNGVGSSLCLETKNAHIVNFNDGRSGWETTDFISHPEVSFLAPSGLQTQWTLPSDFVQFITLSW